MNKHRSTATSKNVANAFSDSEHSTWGTFDGEFKISSFVGIAGVTGATFMDMSLQYNINI